MSSTDEHDRRFRRVRCGGTTRRSRSTVTSSSSSSVAGGACSTPRCPRSPSSWPTLLPQGRRRHRHRPPQVGRLHAPGDGSHPGGRALRRLRLGHPGVARPPADPGHRAGPHGDRARTVRGLRRQAGHLQPLVRARRRLTHRPRGQRRGVAPGTDRPGECGDERYRRAGRRAAVRTSPPARQDGAVTFDRHLVLEQLGGWRGHGRRRPADRRVHRGQLRRRPAHRHLGRARRRPPDLPVPAGSAGERAAGLQRPVRRRDRGGHRRQHRRGPRLLRPRHHPQCRHRAGPAGFGRPPPPADRVPRRVPGPQSPRRHGGALAALAGAGRRPARDDRRRGPAGGGGGPRARAALARRPARAAHLRLADRSVGRHVPAAGHRADAAVPRRRGGAARDGVARARPAAHGGRGRRDPGGRCPACTVPGPPRPRPRSRPRRRTRSPTRPAGLLSSARAPSSAGPRRRRA